MVKLFVDAHVFDGEYQGTRTFIKGIYTVLAGKPGIALYLAAYDLNNLRLNFPAQDSVHFVQYRSTSSVARLGYEIPALIRKYSIDYAHFQYIVPPVKLCRFIVTTHDVIFNEYPEEFSLAYRISKNLLYRVSALRADILTTVSDYSKLSIRKYLGIKSKEIIITPNGVADRFFEPHDKALARARIAGKFKFDKYVLFVSRIEPRKNHVLLLRAYLDLALHLRGYHLVLIGHETIPVPEFDNLLATVPENVRQFIYISNRVDDQDLMDIITAASLFVYPSKAEGFGIPPLEAAALQTPVLCSNSSAMSDFHFFGENHFDPYDFDGFKKKLQNAIDIGQDPACLKRICEIVREKYSWEASAEKLYELIIR
ncbi:MAG TPA: glycosyltransferase family 1 protein [Flavisolibacter sp.]|nr:glycosyltransferase family 1 protein [Flavisolibacter sp.]